MLYAPLTALLLFSLTLTNGIRLGMVDDDPTLVNTYSGLIQGQSKNNVRMFRTIPYAVPPINDLRWAPPVAIPAWGNDTVMATRDPPGCPQKCDLPPHGCPRTTSEDCLFLNVFAPMPSMDHPSSSNADDDSPLPVMLWIHGGNFYQGYGGGPLYNATQVVNDHGVVIVTINYRLGVLGFLWSLDGPQGNYGMMDQRLAIEWVKQNIIAFNGDPNRITIYGQSAGAMSVGLHMIQSHEDGDDPLFAGAIMESNPFGLPFRDIHSWGQVPYRFYNAIDCDEDRFNSDNSAWWECIRGADVDTVILSAYTIQNNPVNELDSFWDIFLPWSPTMGTDLYPEQALFQFQKGLYVDIPYIIGVVANESLIFIYSAFPDPLSKLDADGLMNILMGHEDAQMIRTKYPYPSNRSADYRLWAEPVVTDGLFRCPSWNSSAQHDMFRNAGLKKSKSWFYHFNHVSSFGEQLWGENNTECWDYPCHAAELPYVFHPNPSVDKATYLMSEDYLSDNMQAYWVNFATNFEPGSGDPNVPANASGVEWMMFDGGSDNVIQFEVGPLKMTPGWDTETCSWWNQLGYNWIK